MGDRAKTGAGVAAVTLLLGAAICRADEVRQPEISWSIAAKGEAEPAPIDPATFFQQLVDRYRGLDQYEDTASVEHITARDGEETQRTTTQITTVVDGEELDVQTPMSTLRDDLGLTIPGKALEEIRRKYLIWLAPHMALRFTDEPLRQFRAGVEEGFTATEAEHIEVNNKPMVHLALRSGNGTVSAASQARFDLYVNPRSMLIERIEGEQRLSDGAVMQTRVNITPIRASSATSESEANEEEHGTAPASPGPTDESPPATSGRGMPGRVVAPSL
jgi:hypothetical protein